jgi:hypothetical protein
LLQLAGLAPFSFANLGNGTETVFQPLMSSGCGTLAL